MAWNLMHNNRLADNYGPNQLDPIIIGQKIEL